MTTPQNPTRALRGARRACFVQQGDQRRQAGSLTLPWPGTDPPQLDFSGIGAVASGDCILWRGGLRRRPDILLSVFAFDAHHKNIGFF